MAARPKTLSKPKAKDEPKDAAEVIHAAGLDGSRLIGDLGDQLLADMKAARLLPEWEKLKEEEQAAMIDQAHARASALVAGVVEAIATRGLPYVPAVLGKASFDFGGKTMKMDATVAIDENTGDRILAGVNQCVLVFASAETFESALNSKPEPDQKALIAEGLEHDEDGVVIDPQAEARGGPAR